MITDTNACAVHQEKADADAKLLAAYEDIRQRRTRIYSFDDRPETMSQEEYVETSAAMARAEEIIDAAHAGTIPGVCARLQLLLTTLDGSRWLDRALMESGFFAVYAERESLDGHGQQLVAAIRELLGIEWATALAQYRAALATAERVADFKRDLEELLFARQRAGAPDAELDALNDKLDELADHVSDHESLLRLIHTPTPDWGAYRLKAETAIREGYASDAAEWLMRDANALLAEHGAVSAGKAA